MTRPTDLGIESALRSLAQEEGGVGLLFTPKDAAAQREALEIFAALVADEGQVLLGRRDVPTNAARADAVDAGKRKRDADEDRDDGETADEIRTRHLADLRKRAFAGIA